MYAKDKNEAQEVPEVPEDSQSSKSSFVSQPSVRMSRAAIKAEAQKDDKNEHAD